MEFGEGGWWKLVNDAGGIGGGRGMGIKTTSDPVFPDRPF